MSRIRKSGEVDLTCARSRSAAIVAGIDTAGVFRVSAGDAVRTVVRMFGPLEISRMGGAWVRGTWAPHVGDDRVCAGRCRWCAARRRRGGIGGEPPLADGSFDAVVGNFARYEQGHVDTLTFDQVFADGESRGRVGPVYRAGSTIRCRADDLWKRILGATVRTRALIARQPPQVQQRIQQVYEQLIDR